MDPVEVLAQTLQAEGPDEFPTGYYQYLAARSDDEEKA